MTVINCFFLLSSFPAGMVCHVVKVGHTTLYSVVDAETTAAGQ